MTLTIFSLDAIELELYQMVRTGNVFKNNLQPSAEWTIRFKKFFSNKFNSKNELIWMFNPKDWNRFGHCFPKKDKLVLREFFLDIVALKKLEEQRKFDLMREFLENIYALKFNTNVHNKVIDCVFDFSKLIHINPNYKIMICAPKNEDEQTKLLQFFEQIINSCPKEQVKVSNFLLVFFSRASKNKPLYFKTYILKVDNGKYELIRKRCEQIN